MSTRATKTCRKRRSRRGPLGPVVRAAGFTLLEVLAALLIASVALTYIISSETESIRRSAATRDLREATALAKEKLMEIVAGAEGADSGDFEGRKGWSWHAVREPAPDAFGLEKLEVTVRYATHGREETVVLEELCRP